MSPRTDPDVLVRTFLSDIRSSADKLTDPWCQAITSSNLSGDRTPPVRLRGLLAELNEDERELHRNLIHQHGAVTQDAITHRSYKTLNYDSKLCQLYRQAEADRSSLHSRWYCELSSEDKSAFDDLCLVIAESVIRPCLPSFLPECLHAPLSRLALEYAAIVRRSAAARQERATSLANRGLGNHTIVEPFLCGIDRDAQEATSRLIGRWFRELTPEQQAAFDNPPPTRSARPAEIPTPSSPRFDDAPGPLPREAEGQRQSPKIDLESQALALFFQHPDWDLPRIAQELSVNRQTLYKWTKFRAAAEKTGRLKPRGQKARKPDKGHKTRDGTVEAYQDESEEE